MLPLRYNLRSLLLRRTRALLTAAGIGLAVLVAVLMLALAEGLINGIRDTGHPHNVLVTRRGAETIEFSAIDRRELDVLRYSPHVALAADGQPMASPELFFTTRAETDATVPRQALIRGVLPIALAVHDQVQLVEGRFPAGRDEIITGPLVATQIGVPAEAVAMGRELEFEGQRWRIIGRFQAPGTAFESEIWGALDELMVAARRQELSSIVLRAKDEAALDEMLFDFDLRTDVLVAARREIDYYAAHAESYRPVQFMVYAMAAMLSIGGIFIAMNTILAAVAGRVREVGVLRTVGFRRVHIATAFLIESLVPAVIGGLVAGLIALGLNGLALRIPMGAFRLQVELIHLGLAVLLSLAIGLCGAFWPVWHALRMKTADAIRHL